MCFNMNRCTLCAHNNACAFFIRQLEDLDNDYSYSVDDCPYYKQVLDVVRINWPIIPEHNIIDVDKALEFIESYAFKDDKEVYTNGTIIVPLFRVKQALVDKAYNGFREG